MTRQIVLDTETTGLYAEKGHRIIEIGAVEAINRKLTGEQFHAYINPMREIEEGAIQVHGISNEFLSDKPTFDLILPDFLKFIKGAELIIHNAPFDLGFIHQEFKLHGVKQLITAYVPNVIDTLVLARRLHPGQKNSLDALCKRYHVDLSRRHLHGALLDATLLVQVYLAMTGGQEDFFGLLENESSEFHSQEEAQAILSSVSEWNLPVLPADTDELNAHYDYLKRLGSECA